MDGSKPEGLRRHLLDKYQALLAQLTSRLGSRELASDALHDVYVKLSVAEPADEVHSPVAYLLHMALNVAANIRRRDWRLLGFDEVSALLEIPDRMPGPAQVMEATSDVSTVKRVMAGMSRRRYELCVAAWIDGVSTADLARQHGLALRTIQHELKQATLEIQQALAP